MATNSTAQFLCSLLKQRGMLLNSCKGNTTMQVRSAYEEVKKYATYYSNEQVLKDWVRKNAEKVELLIPKNGRNQKQLNQLNQILSA